MNECVCSCGSSFLNKPTKSSPVGFCSSPNNSSELKVQFCFCPSQLDPLTSDWVALPPMPSPRCLFNIGESANMLFAMAGKDLQTNESLDTVMCYDVESVVLFCLSLALFSPFLAPFAKKNKKIQAIGDNKHQEHLPSFLQLS